MGCLLWGQPTFSSTAPDVKLELATARRVSPVPECEIVLAKRRSVVQMYVRSVQVASAPYQLSNRRAIKKQQKERVRRRPRVRGQGLCPGFANFVGEEGARSTQSLKAASAYADCLYVPPVPPGRPSAVMHGGKPAARPPDGRRSRAQRKSPSACYISCNPPATYLSRHLRRYMDGFPGSTDIAAIWAFSVFLKDIAALNLMTESL
ncbi:hypothetical protein DFH27DRAFT_606343 [Peziza echinospora]|nr:hypothetical protein DFH27DRAFT_606343 [Peziza echinospora]